MTIYALYCLKVILCSSVLMTYYYLCLRKGRFFRWNRIYLLLTAGLSWIIPFLEIPTNWSTPAVNQYMPNIFNVQLNAANVQSTQQSISSETLVYMLYGLVVLGLLWKAGRSVYDVLIVKKNATIVYHEKQKLYLINDPKAADLAPFSVFRSLFWNPQIPLHTNEARTMLLHEQAHIRYGHTYDKLFIQCICILGWVNPVCYLIQAELSCVHEFEADSQCVDNGQHLSKMILCGMYPQHYRNFINPFFQTPIKRRIMMISHKQVSMVSLRKAMALTVLCTTTLFFACANHEQKTAPTVLEPTVLEQEEMIPTESNSTGNETIPFSIVDVKPLFQGKTADQFTNWVNTKVVYPKAAIDGKLQGTVYISFTIDVTGKLIDIKLLRGVDPVLDQEALRVVSLSPDWTPGQKGGKTVPVSFQFPIQFQL